MRAWLESAAALALGAALILLTLQTPTGAQTASRLFATTTANLPTGVGLPLVCTASGAGCVLNVTTSGGAGDFSATRFLAGDGTALLPSFTFTSEPTLGFYRSAAGVTTLVGGTLSASNVLGTTTVLAGGAGFIGLQGRISILAPAVGIYAFDNSAQTFGVTLKTDAAPTVGSGFGTSPAIVAGSTPTVGAVNVGTGAPGTTGTITFNGTAWPVAPHCLCSDEDTIAAGVCKAKATVTTLTVTTTVAWTASDVVNWHCFGSK